MNRFLSADGHVTISNCHDEGMITNSIMFDDKALQGVRNGTSWKKSKEISFSPSDAASKNHGQVKNIESSPLSFNNKKESIKSMRTNPSRVSATKEELHSKIYIPAPLSSPPKSHTTENVSSNGFHDSTTRFLHEKSNLFVSKKLYVPSTQHSGTTSKTTITPLSVDQNAPDFSETRKDRNSPVRRTRRLKPAVSAPDLAGPLFKKKSHSYAPQVVIGISPRNKDKDDSIPSSPSKVDGSLPKKHPVGLRGNSTKQSLSAIYVFENNLHTVVKDSRRSGHDHPTTEKSDKIRWHDSHGDPLVNSHVNKRDAVVNFPMHQELLDATSLIPSSTALSSLPEPAHSHETMRSSPRNSFQHPQEPLFSIKYDNSSSPSAKRVLPMHNHQIFGSNHSSVEIESNKAPSSSKDRDGTEQYTAEVYSVMSSLYNTSNNSASKETKVESIKTLRGPPTGPLPMDEPARAPVGDFAKSKISPQTYLDTLASGHGYRIPTTLGQDQMNITVGPPSTVSPVTYIDGDEDDDEELDDTSTGWRQIQRKKFDHASFGFFTVGVARLGDVETMYSLLSAGMSPNACNEYGESLVRIVCRRGDYETLKVIFQFDCDIDAVVDDQGRNPLHDACSCLNVSASLATVKLIIDYCLIKQPPPSKNMARDDDYDPLFDIHCSAFRLFYKPDCYGMLPLSYVPPENWSHWLQFFALKKDIFFPPDTGDSSLVGSSAASSAMTMSTSAASSSYGSMPAFFAAKAHLELHGPTQHPIPLPVDVARMVASGKVQLVEAQELVAGMKGGLQDERNDANSYSFKYCQLKIDDEKVPINNGEDKDNNAVGKLNPGETDDSLLVNKASENVVNNETDLNEIEVCVEDTSGRIHRLEKRSIRRRSTDHDSGTTGSNDNTNDFDSTAYPDSMSGVEFYSDSKPLKSRPVRSRQQRNPQKQSLDGLQYTDEMADIQWIGANDVTMSDNDSTNYPDSVSGIEFYCETFNAGEHPALTASQLPDWIAKQGSVERFEEICLTDDDADSTAFPDSISGVDFYTEAVPTEPRRRKKVTMTQEEDDMFCLQNNIHVEHNTRAEKESGTFKKQSQNAPKARSYVKDAEPHGNDNSIPVVGITNLDSNLSVEQWSNDEYDREDSYERAYDEIVSRSRYDVESVSVPAVYSNTFCSQVSPNKIHRSLRMEL